MPDWERCLLSVSLFFFFPATACTLVIWLIIFHHKNHNWTLSFCLPSSNKVLCLNIQSFLDRCFYFTAATSTISPGQLHLSISSVSQVESICSDFKVIILSLCRWEITDKLLLSLRGNYFLLTSNESATCYDVCDHLNAWVFRQLYTGF